MEINRREDTYRRASDELARRLLLLYNERIFPRQGKVFADMLFQTGIEAGSIVATLGEVDEKNAKIELANQALLKLTQTDYLLTVLHRGKFYETSQVEELDLFLNALIKSVRDLRNTLYGPETSRFYTQMHAVNMPAAAAQPMATAPYQQPAPVNKSAQASMPSAATVINGAAPQQGKVATPTVSGVTTNNAAPADSATVINGAATAGSGVKSNAGSAKVDPTVILTEKVANIVANSAPSNADNGENKA